MTTKKVTKRYGSDAEELFNEQIIIAHLPAHEREYKFLTNRRFRFDFAWAIEKVAVEVQGGVFVRGGHSTGIGITRDCEKLALANIEGWTVFQVTSAHVRSGTAIAWITEYFKRRKKC
jgi:very-short-patch-repair endonuclease